MPTYISKGGLWEEVRQEKKETEKKPVEQLVEKPEQDTPSEKATEKPVKNLDKSVRLSKIAELAKKTQPSKATKKKPVKKGVK